MSRSTPLVLHGTVTTFRRRCGKPSCRCAAGEPHESPALVFREGGRTKTVTLRRGEVAEVQAAVDRYQRAKAALDRQAADGVTAFRAGRERRDWDR